MNKHKCRTKDCKNKVDDDYIYCSFECAIYDGVFSIKDGWDHIKIEKDNERHKK
jgi:hypothetical protein